MKTSYRAGIAAAVLACAACSLNAQITNTAPVGAMEFTIAPNGYTYIGLPLYRTSIFSGVVTSVASSTVSFADTPFASISMATIAIGSDQVPRYFLEVTSGTDVGALIPILSNTASSVTLNENVSSFLAADHTVKIRPLHTLDSLFPNGAPLRAGVSATSADEVLIYDATRQGSLSYFYSSTSAQWRRGTVPNGNRPILPNQCIYINRKSPSPLTWRFTGAVKLGTTGIDVLTGNNLVPNPYPVAFSLGNSSLFTGSIATGVKGGLTASTADQITIYGAGAPKTYFYQSSTGQWRTGTTVSNDVLIPIGGALLINRRSPSPPFTWVKSQPF